MMVPFVNRDMLTRVNTPQSYPFVCLGVEPDLFEIAYRPWSAFLAGVLLVTTASASCRYLLIAVKYPLLVLLVSVWLSLES